MGSKVPNLEQRGEIASAHPDYKSIKEQPEVLQANRILGHFTIPTRCDVVTAALQSLVDFQ